MSNEVLWITVQTDGGLAETELNTIRNEIQASPLGEDYTVMVTTDEITTIDKDVLIEELTDE